MNFHKAFFSVQMREFLVTFGMERYIESTWSNKPVFDLYLYGICDSGSIS